jgi:hypothetical protein
VTRPRRPGASALGVRRRVTAGLLAACALAACTSAGRPATGDSSAAGETAAASVTGASVTAAPPERASCTGGSLRDDTTVTEILVSPGNRGMVTQLRWAASPDGCALLAVEDPVGVEADPIPDRFVYVSEPRAVAGVPVVMAQDSVWDVTPDARWQRLAFGRAYVAVGRGGDSLVAAQWTRLAREAGSSEREARAAAFASSGMTVAFAVARAVIADVGEPATTTARSGMGTTRALPTLAGWRVRWAADGRQLLLGARPVHASDDRPPSVWLRVDASTGAVVDSSATLPADTAGARWTEGPLLDSGIDLALGAPRTVRVAGATIESRDGRITLTFRDGARRSVGPGAVLAATAGGRFVLALRPRRGPVREGEVPAEVVLYQLHY